MTDELTQSAKSTEGESTSNSSVSVEDAFDQYIEATDKTQADREEAYATIMNALERKLKPQNLTPYGFNSFDNLIFYRPIGTVYVDDIQYYRGGCGHIQSMLSIKDEPHREDYFDSPHQSDPMTFRRTRSEKGWGGVEWNPDLRF
ncbi:MAG TPA: hypothetical protein VFO86_15645 [Terriglobia bacterium]|nr:hypothetical protein [Terriglobia bacterium]